MNIESISDRIKIIREHYSKGSNIDFARFMDEKPNTTSNWVSGTRKIGIDIIDKLKGKIPELNIEWLITGEGEMLTQKKEEAKPIFHPNVKMIPLVSQYAQAGYLCGFSDEEYMETLPTVPFIVDHEPHGHYVAFEVKGDSMFNGEADSLFEGDVLLCREIGLVNWNYKLFINKWKNFVVVHKTDGVLVKRIISHDVETGMITLHSLNPLYNDITICLSEVAQLFSVVKIMRSGDK